MYKLKSYNESNDLQLYLNTSIIKRFARLLRWKENETILDIGMGDGKFTFEGLMPIFPKDFKLLVGSDMPGKIYFAEEKYQLPKVSFMELDIQTKKLNEEYVVYFDHVFSFLTLHWVQDVRLALENIFVMLKPGGQFFITLSEIGFDSTFLNLLKNPKWAFYGIEKYLTPFHQIKDKLPMWKQLLYETGFIDLNCFREYFIFEHKNKEVNDEMLKAVCPAAATTPHDVLDEFLRDYVTEMNNNGFGCTEICPETQQEICVTNVRIIILIGRKPEN